MVIVNLRNPNAKHDLLPLYIDCYTNCTATNWRNLLYKNVKQKEDIKTHAAFHGWIEDENRTLDHILNELYATVDRINKFNFAYHAVLTKQPKIKKNFRIQMDITKDKLIVDGKPNFDLLNQLHDKFVALEGHKTGDNLESVSPYFDISPPLIRWKISKINNIAHELHHYIHSLSMPIEEYVPEIHVHFYKNELVEFNEKDYDNFDQGYKFGQVYVGDVTVGKTYWDAFNDNDDDIPNHDLEPPRFNVADFHVYFGNDVSDSNLKDTELKYHAWLKGRNINKQDAKIMLGKPAVGKVNIAKTFDNQNPKDIRKLMSNYCEIDSIIVDDAECKFDYDMSTDHKDIEYHA